MYSCCLWLHDISYYILIWSYTFFVEKEIRLKMVTNVYYMIYKIKIRFTCVQRFVICMSHCMFQSTHSNLSTYKTVLTNAQITAWINNILHIELVAKSITQSVHVLLTTDHLAYTSKDEQLGCPFLPGLAVFPAEEQIHHLTVAYFAIYINRLI